MAVEATRGAGPVDRLTPLQYKAFLHHDSNGDGRISLADAAGKTAAYRDGLKLLLTKADRNQDFSLNKVEFAAAWRRADTDNDGRVTQTETNTYIQQD